MDFQFYDLQRFSSAVALFRVSLFSYFTFSVCGDAVVTLSIFSFYRLGPLFFLVHKFCLWERCRYFFITSILFCYQWQPSGFHFLDTSTLSFAVCCLFILYFIINICSRWRSSVFLLLYHFCLRWPSYSDITLQINCVQLLSACDIIALNADSPHCLSIPLTGIFFHHMKHNNIRKRAT